MRGGTSAGAYGAGIQAAEILCALARAEYFSRQELLNEVWGYENYPTTRTVDNHILRIAKNSSLIPAHPRYFLTMHGAGYKFTPVNAWPRWRNIEEMVTEGTLGTPAIKNTTSDRHTCDHLALLAVTSVDRPAHCPLRDREKCAQASTERSLRAFENVQKERELQLSRTAAMLAELPTLKALMTTEHALTIQDASEPLWKLAGSELFVLAGPDGRVLGFHGTTPRSNVDVARRTGEVPRYRARTRRGGSARAAVLRVSATHHRRDGK